MYQNTNRHEFREIFRQVLKKMNEKSLLTPLEDQIAEVIALHPEYHVALEADSLEQDYPPEMGQTNPFLHLALHLSVRDQIRLNRPLGVQPLFEKLRQKRGNSHEAEHIFLESLAEALHESTQTGLPPSEEKYLQQLQLRLEGLI